MKESTKIILYIIVIAITLPCSLNLSTSRFIYANKYPKLTNTELTQMSYKLFIWDHTPPKDYR